MALDEVLDGIEERKAKRVAKWERNAAARRAKGVEVRIACDGSTLRALVWIINNSKHSVSHVERDD
jgi:bisphosphoglycerate-dependent phosphoglycerate mutase